MLRSKATEALMKLKEIDKKYKIKASTEEAKILQINSSLSDISAMDEISKHDASSGDKPVANVAKPIMNTRPRLDIRMPEAHMERSTTTFKGNESEPVTIFNEPERKQSSRNESGGNISPRIIRRDEDTEKPMPNSGQETAGKENGSEMLQTTSFRNPPLIISEDEAVGTETSISEDVPEVISSSHPVSNNLGTDGNQEISLKSIDSIIDAEERVQSDLDEDPSTLVDSGTYSDDFIETFSTENTKESNSSMEKNFILSKPEILEPELPLFQVKYVTSTPQGYHQRRNSPEVDNNTEPETEDIEEELVSVNVLEVVANVKLDEGVLNNVKKIDHDVSKEIENPMQLLRQKSSQSSSARSSKKRHMGRRPRTSASSRDTESQEFSSNLIQKKESETTNTSGTSNPSERQFESGPSSPEANSLNNAKERDSKNPQTASFLEVQKDPREADANGVTQSRKDKAVMLKMKSKHLKSGTRAKDSSTKEPPPPDHSEGSKVHKYKSLKDYEDACKPEKRTSKIQGCSRGQKGRSNESNIENSRRSKRRTKEGSLRQCKNQTEEELGLEYHAREVSRIRQQMKEYRLQQGGDRLRNRVRGYVEKMMIEQRRLLAHDGQFCGSIDGFYHKAGTGLRQTENLRSLFFKPLDLPNVAAFKRPDSQHDQTPDPHNDRYLNLHMIRDRILGIRHWLKQQFVLYKDYSNLVSTINAKYMPVTLEETKKMIIDIQRFNDHLERRRYVR